LITSVNRDRVTVGLISMVSVIFTSELIAVICLISIIGDWRIKTNW